MTSKNCKNENPARKTSLSQSQKLHVVPTKYNKNITNTQHTSLKKFHATQWHDIVTF